MDQPKIERMLRLMKMLTANTLYTVDDLAERLGMSRRTVYRYIDTFREAGFVIKKSGDRIRLDKESPHFKDISQLVHFTEEEAAILKRAIESIDDTNLLKQNLKRKLYSVYDNKILADTVVRGENATTVRRLIESIEQRRQVILHDYRSAHGGAVRDRRVEPFAFTANYVQAWCFDLESGSCKLFKLSRIGSVEPLDDEWIAADRHAEGFIDIFRMNGNNRRPVRLRLGLMARNLLIEEYPLAEKHLTAVPSAGTGEAAETGTRSGTSVCHWILDTEVADYAGVARFVAGLLDDIEIVDTPELDRYVDDYLRRYRPSSR